MASLVGELDDKYGAIHDEELVVPLATMVVNKENTSKQSPGMKTKKLLLGIMGVTAVVVSSASLFVSVSMDSSGRQASTAEDGFLLNDRGGADDDCCLPASGPWPTGSFSDGRHTDDDDLHTPFVSCFVSTTGGYCWSHSFYDGEDWETCTPEGFGEAWALHSPHDSTFDDDNNHSGYLAVETCGTPCTEFSKNYYTTCDF